MGEAFGEGYSWKTGFSFAEDRMARFYSTQKTASRMYDAFLLYYRFSMNGDDQNQETLRALGEVARTASEAMDPNLPVYYFICYTMGASGVGSQSDTTLYLSKAFKALQVRANTIGDNGMRESFMQNTTWNGRLYKAARENKLI
jgi:hypothetical protein